MLWQAFVETCNFPLAPDRVYHVPPEKIPLPIFLCWLTPTQNVYLTFYMYGRNSIVCLVAEMGKKRVQYNQSSCHGLIFLCLGWYMQTVHSQVQAAPLVVWFTGTHWFASTPSVLCSGPSLPEFRKTAITNFQHHSHSREDPIAYTNWKNTLNNELQTSLPKNGLYWIFNILFFKPKKA